LEKDGGGQKASDCDDDLQELINKIIKTLLIDRDIIVFSYWQPCLFIFHVGVFIIHSKKYCLNNAVIKNNAFNIQNGV
jgi:hypothetical protein